MPKTKKVDSTEEKEEVKEILLDDEDKVVDAELIVGDIIDDEDGDDEVADDDEVDPFKDRWEE